MAGERGAACHILRGNFRCSRRNFYGIGRGNLETGVGKYLMVWVGENLGVGKIT